jgi:hypothetical protein
MRALLFEKDDRIGVGGFDVAGRCLLVRQLQVLRDLGIEDVVVEVCEGPRALERATFLLGDDPLVSRVTLVPSGAPLGVAELARRGGLRDDEPYLALPGDTLFRATLDLERVPARYELAHPPGTDLPDAELTVETLVERASVSPQTLEGWGVRVPTESAAHQLGCAALSGNAHGIMIHATELRPGVWCARGARLADDAVVHAPVLLGVDTLVMNRAQLGPRVVLGDRVVVERNAMLSDAAVAEGTLIGESTQFKRVRADARGTTGLDDGVRTEIGDPLVLSPRNERSAPLAPRAFACLLLLMLGLPWAIAVLARKIAGKQSVAHVHTSSGTLRVGVTDSAWLDVVPCLVDVVTGLRDLVGINDRRAVEIALSRGASPSLRAGAIDISRELAPLGSASTLLRMWRWYAAHKSARLDLALWLRTSSKKTS